MQRHSEDRPADSAIDRRTFLVGALVAGVAVACGDDESSGRPADDVPVDGSAGTAAATPSGSDVVRPGRDVGPEYDGDSRDLPAGTFILAQRFPQTVSVPGEVRLPHTLQRDAQFVSDGPLELGAQVVDVDGVALGERLTAERLDVTPSAYYVWRPTIDEPGIYSLVIDGGPPEGAAFQVFAPGEVSVPLPGAALEPFETPTAEAPGGVDPICTRDPVCPFHSMTLTQALAQDRPTIYMIGTPAFCRTGTCTPALEALIEVSDEFAEEFGIVHAEVYTDLTAQVVTPAVEALGLSYEPVLFVTDASGTIVERIDAIWNAEELRQRLSRALG